MLECIGLWHKVSFLGLPFDDDYQACILTQYQQVTSWIYQLYFYSEF